DTASGIGAFDDLPDVKKTGGAFDDLPEAPKVKRFIMPPTAPRSSMELGAQNVMGEMRARVSLPAVVPAPVRTPEEIAQSDELQKTEGQIRPATAMERFR